MNLLVADNFKHYIDRFNADDVEDVVNLIPNAGAWDWMAQNIPLFTCPDASMEEMYYYRWWTFRKHIKQTPAGRIITEFITPVRHAGSYNSISCALGHHIAEARWLKDQTLLDEYIRFWFKSNDGKPEPKFHNYSSWVAAAMWDRSLVTGDRSLLLELFDDLVADYRAWESEKLLPNGLFWQYDVRDGMEESITGSRTHKNARPTINSYVYANAQAITQIGMLAKRHDLVAEFRDKAESLRNLIHANLWDESAKFFKAQANEGPLSDARRDRLHPLVFQHPQAGSGRSVETVDRPAGILGAVRHHHRRAPASEIPITWCRQVRMGRCGLAVCDFADTQRAGQRVAELQSVVCHARAFSGSDADVHEIAALGRQAVHRRISG